MTAHDEARPLLVLWDIDHTLLHSGGVSRDAYAAAFAVVTGRPLTAMAEMAGRTELLIAGDTLRLHGLVADPVTVERLTGAVAVELEARAEQLRACGRGLAGAREVLAELAALPGVRQSVLTGNTRPIAELKLRAFELDGHLDLAAGAYGDDAPSRPDLLPVAWSRAERRYCRAFTGPDTVIVGDTVLDVATAKAGSARAVAVATGSTQAALLAAAGADTVLPDLADIPATLEAITGRLRSRRSPRV
jgi:phosphoglycolate phosphatase